MTYYIDFRPLLEDVLQVYDYRDAGRNLQLLFAPDWMTEQQAGDLADFLVPGESNVRVSRCDERDVEYRLSAEYNGIKRVDDGWALCYGIGLEYT